MVAPTMSNENRSFLRSRSIPININLDKTACNKKEIQKNQKKVLTKDFFCDIIVERRKGRVYRGGIAQLARAIGSYPIGRGFKSNFRYQHKADFRQPYDLARWSSG